MCGDNCKPFALDKKFLVARGKNVDLSSLVKNVAGRVILADDLEQDVAAVEWPRPTEPDQR